MHAAVHSAERQKFQSTAPSVMYCVVPGCSSQMGVTKDVVFHEFPSKMERRELWTLAVRALHPPTKNPWVPSEYAKICSKHFKPDDYIQGPKKRYLAPHVTPSQFPPCDVQTRGRRGRPRKQRKAEGCSSATIVGESPGALEPQPPAGTTMTPIVIRHLTGDNSPPKRDHQDTCGTTLTRIKNVASGENAHIKLNTATMERSENIDPCVRLSTGQSPDDVPPQHCHVTALSVGCQTQVSGLTIAAYEEQIQSLRDECKRLRDELWELRCSGVDTVCSGSVKRKHSADLNGNV